VPSGNYLYTAWDRTCVRVDALGSGTVEPIAQMMPYVDGVSLDGANLWLADDYDNLRVFGPRGGSPRVGRTVAGLVGKTVVAARSGFSIYRQYVFFVASGNIYRWNGFDTFLTPIETSTVTALDIAVDTQYVWWIGQSGTQQSVNRVSRGGLRTSSVTCQRTEPPSGR
jgi:hypothetical protein